MNSIDHFKRQGTLLEGLIRGKGYSIYSFAIKLGYAKSGLYDIVCGKRSILSLESFTLIKMASLLDYKSIDEFLHDLSIELFK